MKAEIETDTITRQMEYEMNLLCSISLKINWILELTITFDVAQVT